VARIDVRSPPPGDAIATDVGVQTRWKHLARESRPTPSEECVLLERLQNAVVWGASQPSSSPLINASSIAWPLDLERFSLLLRRARHPERSAAQSTDLVNTSAIGSASILRLRPGEPALSEADGLRVAQNDNRCAKRCSEAVILLPAVERSPQ
jgi:hypothetical protein